MREPLLAGFAAALVRSRIQVAFVTTVFAVSALDAAGLARLWGSGIAPLNGLRAVFAEPEFPVLLAMGTALSVLLPLLSPIRASALTFVGMLPIVYLGFRVAPAPPAVPMESALTTLLAVFVANVLASYYTETRRKQRLVEVFGRYVPAQVARAAARDPDGISMRSESREMSVLFCDVQRFTTLAERLSPREVSDLLATVFTPLSRIIYEHEGVIDKYMGDAIMAFWGAPVIDPHHASKALAAAFEMQAAMDGIRTEFARRGWPEIRIGIGINTGVVYVGNMGSAYRVAYTVIGDAVNLASRLQDLTRVFRAPVIVGEATRRAFPGLTYRELGLVQVKGKNELVRIYEPCNPSASPESTMAASMHQHNAALRAYYARDWSTAAPLFESLKAQQPDDPLFDYYLGRIAEFRDEPPPEGWRGELRFTVG